jgi:hypothetical protein
MGCLLRARIFLPLFVSLLVLVFVSSITFVIASLGLADTCIDDPDARFLSVADHYLDGISPIIFEFVEVYLSRKLQQCIICSPLPQDRPRYDCGPSVPQIHQLM